MRDLTPAAMQCQVVNCPSIHELPDGRLLIVGKRAQFWQQVGGDEHAITISPDLLNDFIEREIKRRERLA